MFPHQTSNGVLAERAAVLYLPHFHLKKRYKRNSSLCHRRNAVVLYANAAAGEGFSAGEYCDSVARRQWRKVKACTYFNLCWPRWLYFMLSSDLQGGRSVSVRRGRGLVPAKGPTCCSGELHRMLLSIILHGQPSTPPIPLGMLLWNHWRGNWNMLPLHKVRFG